MLDLLNEYGCLKKSQLAFMTINNMEKHLQNVDGYLEQLYRFKLIEISKLDDGNFLIYLTGYEKNDDILFAFDVMMEFNEHIVSHKRGKMPITIKFFVNCGKSEMNIIVVNLGYENEIEDFVNDTFLSSKDSVFFLLYNKNQMKLLHPNCQFSFVMKEGDEIQFFEGGS